MPAPPPLEAGSTAEEIGIDQPGPHFSVGPLGVHLQLIALQPVSGQLTLVLPIDADLPARLHAAGELWRRMNGGRASAPDGLSPQRRARLIASLRALDARFDGASVRDIARGLFGPERVPDGTAWKAHDLRSRTKRLVETGLTLMHGGYRKLLRPD